MDSINIATNGLTPQVTILIDASIEEASMRNAKKLVRSKFDDMGNVFFHKQRSAFLELSSLLQWNVLNGSDSIENIHSLITDIVKGV
ncbi:hypothetical protein HY249_03345 [Candidatus Azambacteria bacterium]|nr:hypothetical protein [Candidatus Azambacteria bacterium]